MKGHLEKSRLNYHYERSNNRGSTSTFLDGGSEKMTSETVAPSSERIQEYTDPKRTTQPGQFSVPSVDMIAAQAERLGLGQEFKIDVRDTTPFLPKVAFVTITLASMAGATFTGREWFHLGLGPLAVRWLLLWTAALALGFSTWRTVYHRTHERGLDDAPLAGLQQSLLDHARLISRVLAGLASMGTIAILMIPYLDAAERTMLMVTMGLMAGLLWTGVTKRWTAGVVLLLAMIQAGLWGVFDTFDTTQAVVRTVHLVAFGLWLGGALWNLMVAIPSGRDHPVIEAVIAQARQLQRFRWVVRFALPTIIVTGLIQSDVFLNKGMSWWSSLPGVLIPVKVLLIIALIVIFITCPLYRQCSPVKGVCNVEDLADSSAKQ